MSRASTLLVLILYAGSAIAALPTWTLEIDRLDMGIAQLEDIAITGPASPASEASVKVLIGSVVARHSPDASGPLQATCPGDVFAVSQTLCRGGSWTFRFLENWPELRGQVTQAQYGDGGTIVETRGHLERVEWIGRLEAYGGNLQLFLTLPAQDITALTVVQRQVSALSWLTEGQIEGSATAAWEGGSPVSSSIDLAITGVGFDSPDGLYAGAAVEGRFEARAAPGRLDSGALKAEISGGELLLKDFYRDFSERGVTLEAQVGLEGDVLAVNRAILGDGDGLHVAGEGRVTLGDPAPPAKILLREFRLVFPNVYDRYIEPIAAVWQLDGLDTSGTVSWTGDWSPDSARSGQLLIEDFNAEDSKRGRFAIRGLQGELETGTTSRLSWDAVAFEKLDLGAGSANLELSQESVRLIEPLRMPVLGGSLSLDALDLVVPREGEPDIQVEAAVENIEMRAMSGALGWPEFSGTLSGRIPGVSYSGGVLDIEGALEFQVFDGAVTLTDLRVERPFGVLPSLAANITAQGLDLDELTQTFEFGRIAGRIDGYVRDLRMLDWKPVQFDAWFGTPEGAGRNDISRQAVSHLTTIGGGSPTAMLSGPVLRLFNNFSYRRLGLGCLLQDNICRIRGIEEQGEAVLLLEGAGIPKISIQAYNRAVDWPQLVAQLVAVSSGDEVRIGD